MGARIRRLDDAVRGFERDAHEVGEQLLQARLRIGASCREVATHAGVSDTTIRRAELGRLPAPRVLARHAAALGMRVRLRAYPEGAPLRDAGQMRLMRAFLEEVGPANGLRWRHEVPVRPGDPRAFDSVYLVGSDSPEVCGAVEYFARFHDGQAQLRQAHLKMTDAGLDRLIVVSWATRHNRATLAAAAHVVRELLPLGTREVLAALRRGRDPGANGLVQLRPRLL